MLLTTVFTSFTSAFLLISSSLLDPAFALPGARPAHGEHAPYVAAKVTPRFIPQSGNHIPRAPAPFGNISTVSVTTSKSSASTPTVPFGVIPTVISGTTYSLTYVSTTATKPTTILESNSQTTTTATYSSGAPIWIVPILPPGFPLPPPPPPPIAPPPGPVGGGGPPPVGGGCVFGCGEGGDDGNNPTTEQNSQSPTSTASKTSTSKSSSSSLVSGAQCSYGCQACLGRREAAPTFTPPKREISNLFQYGALLKQRNVPMGDGLPDLFNEVKSAGNTAKVELAARLATGVSSSQFITFDNAEHNIYVSGLEGCTSVIVVSRKGAWASHFWETPAFTFTGTSDRFQADVLDYLNTDLGSHRDSFDDSSTTKIYIMTTTTQENNLNGPGAADNGNWPPEYPGRISQITTVLNELLPGVPIDTFVYQRQKNENLLNSNVYGKAIVMYSNAQNENPNNWEDEWNPSRHVWQVYTQGKLIGEDNWIPCTGNQKRGLGDSCPISSKPLSTSKTASSSPSATKSNSVSTTKPVSSSTAKPTSISSSTKLPSSPTTKSSSTSSTKANPRPTIQPSTSTKPSTSIKPNPPPTPTPSSTSSAPTPTPEPVDPNKPTNLKCHGPNTPSSLTSFNGNEANGPINTFCTEWISDYTYSSFRVTMLKDYPIDGKAWYESSKLIEIQGIVRDYNQAKADTDEQKKQTISNCVKTLTNILWYCDYGSGDKWGGVGEFSGQMLGIAGNTGSKTLPLGN